MPITTTVTRRVIVGVAVPAAMESEYAGALNPKKSRSNILPAITLLWDESRRIF